jgi:hypothetical protein
MTAMSKMSRGFSIVARWHLLESDFGWGLDHNRWLPPRSERRRQAAEADKACRARLKILRQRDAGSVWREIEQEIERRNPAGYDNAMRLLSDVQVLGLEEGGRDDFDRRLGSIRARHEKKKKFMERLSKLGCDSGGRLV